MTDSVFQLNCQCNNYPWGKTGHDSLAARLCEKTPGTGFKIQDGKEYAEMWMGDYPELPAKSLDTGEDLHSIIERRKSELLGASCIKKFGVALPFLPKILSIQKALPLQIHPDKELAERLHQKDPEKFADTNHKPEIALALSKFEVFAGWKPFEKARALFNLKPLQGFLPSNTTDFSAEVLRSVAHAILTSTDSMITETQNALASIPRENYGDQSYIVDLLPRLQQQYSKSDPGNLVALLCMNYMVLSAGDSIYVPADGIHAYLSGDIVECMARSNNVINTGFCPRADRDDIELFSSSLTFNSHRAEEMLLESRPSPKGRNGKTVVYAPPLSEFSMLATMLQQGETETISPIQGPTVMIVTKGSGTMTADGKTFDVKEGYVFFVGHGKEISYRATGSLRIYAAFAE